MGRPGRLAAGGQQSRQRALGLGRRRAAQLLGHHAALAQQHRQRRLPGGGAGLAAEMKEQPLQPPRRFAGGGQIEHPPGQRPLGRGKAQRLQALPHRLGQLRQLGPVGGKVPQHHRKGHRPGPVDEVIEGF